VFIRSRVNWQTYIYCTSAHRPTNITDDTVCGSALVSSARTSLRLLEGTSRASRGNARKRKSCSSTFLWSPSIPLHPSISRTSSFKITRVNNLKTLNVWWPNSMGASAYGDQSIKLQERPLMLPFTAFCYLYIAILRVFANGTYTICARARTHVWCVCVYVCRDYSRGLEGKLQNAPLADRSKRYLNSLYILSPSRSLVFHVVRGFPPLSLHQHVRSYRRYLNIKIKRRL